MTTTPPIAFWGLSERDSYTRDGRTNIWKWNLLGVKSVVISHIFPMSLGGFGMVLAFYQPECHGKQVVYLTDEEGRKRASVDIAWQAKEKGTEPGIEELAIRSEGPWVPDLPWTLMVLPGEKLGLISEPGPYTVHGEWEGGDVPIGQLHFALVEPPPLTPARIAALKSDPGAMKFVRMEIRCNKCGDAIRAYAGLERSATSEAESYIWYENLPDAFVCSCGAQSIKLETIRRNLHGLLGLKGSARGQTDIVAMYEAGALHNVRTNFAVLLDQNTTEETFQKFFEENPILLHSFAAEEIFFKGPILNLYQTDITVLNHQRELILIELEKPTTKILKKDGGVHSELQHAFDQVGRWLHACDEHRVAVLDSLRIDKARVGAVKAVIVAGRDEGYEKEHLRMLKGRDFGRITLLTYDDLLAGFHSLLREIGKL